MYAGQMKVNHVYQENNAFQGPYDITYLARFVCSCIFFPCYNNPDLALIKSSWNIFSLWVFSKGSLLKHIGVLCMRFWFKC
jgi:hypothetical protein